VWPYRHAGAGRREFGRLVLVSLAATTRAELETHKARGRRMRARRAERRLAELEEALERLESGAPPRRHAWYGSPGAEAAVVVALLASVAALAAAVAVRGPEGLLVGALDVVMLLAAVGWFAVAVGRRARVRGVAPSPPDGGSTGADGGR
jgi:Flp pilus assembly protein TadB